jgi:CspA family cold shock protein
MSSRYSERSEASLRDITAVVKWFNPSKGFGFVQLNDGSPDAFLHVSVLEQVGQASLPEGTTIICDIASGQRGPQVAVIHRIESMPDTAPLRGPRHGRAPHYGSGSGSVVEGRVKFFNAEKGFGFVSPDGGGKDVFVSARTLERARLMSLEADQRVRLTTRMGQKGPMAESVEIIE